jgi:hypothetical protein
LVEPDSGFLVTEADALLTGVDPAVAAGGLVLVPFAKEKHIGSNVGACRALERAVGQPDSSEQVGLLVHGLPGRTVLGIEGVGRRDHPDDPTGFDQVQGFQDEVIVHRVPVRVVPGIVQHVLPKGDVANHDVEVPVRYGGIGEGLRADGRVRVDGLADRCCDRVQLDAGHLSALGRRANECPGPGAWFQYPPRFEAKIIHGLPHRLSDPRIGVMGIQHRPLSRPILILGELLTELFAFCLELGPWPG